jgi:hypothetical protein
MLKCKMAAHAAHLDKKSAVYTLGKQDVYLWRSNTES